MDSEIRKIILSNDVTKLNKKTNKLIRFLN